MSIDPGWYDGRHDIIVARFEAGWGWDHAADAVAGITRLLDAASHPVSITIECDTSYIPPDLLIHFDWIAASPIFTHPNSNAVLLVFSSTFLRTFADVFMRVYREAGCKVQFCHSIADAVTKTRQHAGYQLTVQPPSPPLITTFPYNN